MNDLSSSLLAALLIRPGVAALGSVLLKALATDAGVFGALAGGYLAAAIVLLLLYAPGKWIAVVLAHPVACLARALLTVGATFAFVNAMLRLPVAGCVAIVQTTPLLTVVICHLLGRQAVGRLDFLALAISLGGVAIMLRPSFTMEWHGVALALLASLLAAGATIASADTARKMGGMPTAVAATVLMALLLSPILIVMPVAPDLETLKLTLLVGLCLIGAECGLILLLAKADTGLVVSFHHVRLLWAVALAYLFIGEIPDNRTWLGITIILIGVSLRTLLTRIHSPWSTG